MRHACFLIGSSFGKQLLGLRHNLVNVANLMRNCLRKYSTQEKDNYSPCRMHPRAGGNTFQQGFPGKKFNSNFTICKFIHKISPFPHLETGYGLRNGEELVRIIGEHLGDLRFKA